MAVPMKADAPPMKKAEQILQNCIEGRSTPALSLGNSLFAEQIAKTVLSMRRDLR
jgi:hypothetical protein